MAKVKFSSSKILSSPVFSRQALKRISKCSGVILYESISEVINVQMQLLLMEFFRAWGEKYSRKQFQDIFLQVASDAKLC